MVKQLGSQINHINRFMKLLELIEPKYKQTTLNPKRDAYSVQRNVARSDNVSQLSSGRHAQVVAPKSHPHSVLRVATISQFERDANLQYLLQISKNDRIGSNPYFPRVYKIHTYKDEESRNLVVIEMEKLEPYNLFTSEELIAVGNRGFNDFESQLRTNIRTSRGMKPAWSKRQNKQPSVPSDKSKQISAENINNYDVVRLILDLLTNAISNSDDAKPKRGSEDAHATEYFHSITSIKDTSLKQALLLLKSMVGAGKFSNDLHETNIMFRRTPYGVQLVLTDPIG